MFPRTVVAPALLAAIAVLASAKIALLAQHAARTLTGPAALEARVMAGRDAAPTELEPSAGPGAGTPPRGPTPKAAAVIGEVAAPPEQEPALGLSTGSPPTRAPAPRARPQVGEDGAPPEVERPAPHTAAAHPPVAPARRLAPERLSQSEIEVLQQLAERRAALDRREQELDRHAALLATAEADLTAQLKRLEQLRAEIAAAVTAHDAKEEAKLVSLVKIYETMKPKAAAEIFDRLEMPILISVVERMRAPKSADVLARMDPAKAKQVTAELARRTELLRTAGSS
jgi:flagellar motility protein MotE (MotC chaperone)